MIQTFLSILFIHCLIGLMFIASNLKEFEQAATQAIENQGFYASKPLRLLILCGMALVWPMFAKAHIKAAYQDYKLRRALSKVSDKMRKIAYGKDAETAKLLNELADGLKDLSKQD